MTDRPAAGGASGQTAGGTVTGTATACALLVDEWTRAGVRHAVVAPGSRSTPLALALTDRDELAVHVVHDERSAAFLALGIGRATGVPAVLLCTSGTAAANLHPAVVESHQAEVPLVVCTADRPPELHDVAAPQTIDQRRLYGPAVRWYCDPGPAEQEPGTWWRSIGSRSVLDACGVPPGPVHLNLMFREPLVGVPGDLPEGRPDGAPWHRAVGTETSLDADGVRALVEVLEVQRGVVVAGEGAGPPDTVHALAGALGWPVLADPLSGARVPRPGTVAAFDALLRHRGFADAHLPEVVLRLGRPPASKVLSQWLASSGAVQVQVSASPRWIDPDRLLDLRVVASPDAVGRALVPLVTGARGTTWAGRWQHAERRAQAAIADALASGDPALGSGEPAIARTVLGALPRGATLVVSSSMPVRDLEWYGAPRDDVRVLANRGANGIDGVVSTAVGVALGSGGPTVLLIGDVAFLHDTNGLLSLRTRDVSLTVVVVDNDGGGIFSFLPQASALGPARFEHLFGTPHEVDPCAVADAHGLEAVAPDRLTHDDATAWFRQPGARVVRLRTDRLANVEHHDAVHRAVAAALDQA